MNFKQPLLDYYNLSEIEFWLLNYSMYIYIKPLNNSSCKTKYQEKYMIFVNILYII